MPSLVNPRIYLTDNEIKDLMRKSDLKGFLEVFITWGWIAFAFTIVALFPNPIVIIIALFIIGGKQLGCAIIMHDCSHHSLFKTNSLNQTIGNLLGAYPIWHNLKDYKPYHIAHHREAGTEKDPDILLTKGYATTPKSLIRKFLRDFSGITGVKAFIAVIAMNLGLLNYNLAGDVHKLNRDSLSFNDKIKLAFANLKGPIAANMLLFTILLVSGYPLLYLLWIGALITTNPFVLRIRSLHEHAMVPDQDDPQQNVRTTKANFIEKLLFAPLNVNYHAEHHMLMAAPSYNYPKMHKILLQNGYYKTGLLGNSYWEIIKKAASATIINKEKYTV